MLWQHQKVLANLCITKVQRSSSVDRQCALPWWYSPEEPDWMTVDLQQIAPRLSLYQNLRKQNKRWLIRMSTNEKCSRTGSLPNPFRSALIGKKTTSKLNWWQSSLNLLNCFGTSGQRAVSRIWKQTLSIRNRIGQVYFQGRSKSNQNHAYSPKRSYWWMSQWPHRTDPDVAYVYERRTIESWTTSCFVFTWSFCCAIHWSSAAICWANEDSNCS